MSPHLHSRHQESLLRELGDVVVRALSDGDVTEVFLNPSGELWIDCHSKGLVQTGERMAPEQAESLLSTVAGLLDRTIGPKNPILEAELPLEGSRIEGLLPPVAPAPVFAIRKRATAVFSLEELQLQGVLSADQVEFLRAALLDRQNILVSGGPGSGKTTFVNALLREMEWLAHRTERLLLLEDTYELQCTSSNHVTLHTSAEVTLRDLVRASLRLRPDRLIVGEVRGPEALDLLKAWNTGCPGGCATVHANSAADALDRVHQLILEAGVSALPLLVARAIDLVVHMDRSGSHRKVQEIASIHGLDDSGDYDLHIVGHIHPRESAP